MALRRSVFFGWAAVAVLAAAAALTYPLWLAALGESLVRVDDPAPADVAVVLAGDGFGHRILRGAELARQGLVPLVLVSGPDSFYGFNEAELAIPFAVRAGYPERWFVAVPHRSRSTAEEAAAIAAELRRRGVASCALVTSSYHTRRAGRLFRAAAPEVRFRVIAAQDEHFRPAQWWRSREGRKIFALEWIKTVSCWLGL